MRQNPLARLFYFRAPQLRPRWLTNGRSSPKDKSDSRDARTYFRIRRQTRRFGKSSWVCVPVEILCAQCLLCSEFASSYALRKKFPLSIWSWRRDLNPRPSDYKSDALPAELRQHNLPVTGHKVNKLAQRQSACNILTFGFYRGSVTCMARLLLYCNNSPLPPATASRRKVT